jgi:hypothetical protein
MVDIQRFQEAFVIAFCRLDHERERCILIVSVHMGELFQPIAVVLRVICLDYAKGVDPNISDFHHVGEDNGVADGRGDTLEIDGVTHVLVIGVSTF